MCIHVLGISILTLFMILVSRLEMFRQCGIFCFPFDYLGSQMMGSYCNNHSEYSMLKITVQLFRHDQCVVCQNVDEIYHKYLESHLFFHK